jgi:hypothetical protein
VERITKNGREEMLEETSFAAYNYLKIIRCNGQVGVRVLFWRLDYMMAVKIPTLSAAVCPNTVVSHCQKASQSGTT